MVRGWTGRQLSAKPGSGWVQEAQDKTAMLLGFFAQWRRNESAKDGGPPRPADHVLIALGSGLGGWQPLSGASSSV